MDKKTLDSIKKKLEEEEISLNEQITNVIKPGTKPGENSPDAKFPQYGNKEDDNANEVAAFQDNLALESDLEKSLADVKNALKKLADGTYGTCEKAGDKISDERLMAFPTARLCLKHTAKQ